MIPPPDLPPQPIQGSCTLPIQALADPARAVARKLEQPLELIQIASVETLNPETIKVKFYIKRA